MKTGTYPIPSYAGYIWARGHELVISFPPLTSTSRHHEVVVKPTPDGIQALMQIFRAREQTRERSFIGTKGSPTQHNLDEILKTMRVTRLAARKQEIRDMSIEDLGL